MRSVECEVRGCIVSRASRTMHRDGIVTLWAPGLPIPGRPALGQGQACLGRVRVVMRQREAAWVELKPGHQCPTRGEMACEIRYDRRFTTRRQEDHDIPRQH